MKTAQLPPGFATDIMVPPLQSLQASPLRSEAFRSFRYGTIISEPIRLTLQLS